MQRAPGPRGLAALVLPLKLQRDPLGTIEALAHAHGRIIELRFGAQRAFIVFHPDHIRRVFADAAERYVKPKRVKSVLAPIFGNGLFTSEGDHWRHSRRLAQPFFSRQALADTMPLINEAAQTMVARLTARRGEIGDVHEECARLSMHVPARMFLGMELGPEFDAMVPVVKRVSEHLARQILGVFPLPLWLPTAGNRAYRKLTSWMHRLCDELIAARRRDGGGAEDFVGRLLAARDAETGRGYSDAEIRDELCTFFLAGHHTTANAMAWAFYLLATHPEAAERVRAEEERVVGGRAVTAADLPELEYTLRVVEEANRLYPQGWMVGRETAADDEIDGFAIPRGSAMFPSAWLAHRDRQWWGEEPTRFDPDHFTPERAKARPRYAYFPFGAGQRMCIGNNLSILETVVALVAVLRRFRLELPDGFTPRPRASFALDLEGGLPARAISR